MSNRRAQLRREARARRSPHVERLGHDEDLAIVPGWCESAGDLEATRRSTHDTLIELLGSRRRSGVTWRHYVGADALGAVAELGREGSDEWRAMCAEITRLLNEHGGHLVLATAAGDRGAL